MGRASEKRQGRIRSLLLSTLSEIIRDELNDPRIGNYSITDIQVAADLSFADVKVAEVCGRQATEACARALTAAAPLIRNRLRDATDLRTIPQLRFSADHSGEYMDQIEQLLKEIPPIPELVDDEGDEAVVLDILNAEAEVETNADDDLTGGLSHSEEEAPYQR